MPRYYEDIQIGEHITTAKRHVTREEIIAFAKEYDPQPMHISDEGGKASLFGKLVGCGWHTFTLTMRLIVDANPFEGTPMIGHKVENVKLFTPLVPNTTIYAKSEVLHKRPSGKNPSLGYVTVQTDTYIETATNQEDTLLASQTWQLVIPLAKG